MDYKKLEDLIERCGLNTELEEEGICIPPTCTMWYDKKTGEIHSFNSHNPDIENKEMGCILLLYGELPNKKSGPLPELYGDSKISKKSERKYLEVALNHIKNHYSRISGKK